jgi:hypothetical protein
MRTKRSVLIFGASTGAVGIFQQPPLDPHPPDSLLSRAARVAVPNRCPQPRTLAFALFPTKMDLGPLYQIGARLTPSKDLTPHVTLDMGADDAE